MSNLLALGAIERVPPEMRDKGFYSRYFLVPKAKGDMHPILDLRNLNTFIRKAKFRMVMLACIIPSLQKGDWYAALNLKDVYFHILIFSKSQKVPMVSGGTGPIPVYGPPIWAVYSPKGVYQMYDGGSRVSAAAQGPGVSISGRLADKGHVSNRC